MGSTEYDDGELRTDDFDNDGGRFGGNGTINASRFNNRGELGPGSSPGVLTINGNFNQTTEGSLVIELAESGRDELIVNGSATLDGVLELALLDGFVPGSDEQFVVLTAQSLTGQFANVTSGQALATSDGSGAFEVYYGAESPFQNNLVVLSNFLTLLLRGDVNNDGAVNNLDITPFIIALSVAVDEKAFEAQVPEGNFIAADIDISGGVDNLDITPFIGVLGAAVGAAVVPEPSAFACLTFGWIVLTRRRRE